jgi:hypothetical protein
MHGPKGLQFGRAIPHHRKDPFGGRPILCADVKLPGNNGMILCNHNKHNLRRLGPFHKSSPHCPVFLLRLCLTSQKAVTEGCDIKRINHNLRRPPCNSLLRLRLLWRRSHHCGFDQASSLIKKHSAALIPASFIKRISSHLGLFLESSLHLFLIQSSLPGSEPSNKSFELTLPSTSFCAAQKKRRI